MQQTGNPYVNIQKIADEKRDENKTRIASMDEMRWDAYTADELRYLLFNFKAGNFSWILLKKNRTCMQW